MSREPAGKKCQQNPQTALEKLLARAGDGGRYMSMMSIVTYGVLIAVVTINVVLSACVVIGGWFDLRSLFRELSEEQADIADDGRVDGVE